MLCSVPPAWDTPFAAHQDGCFGGMCPMGRHPGEWQGPSWPPALELDMLDVAAGIPPGNPDGMPALGSVLNCSGQNLVDAP